MRRYFILLLICLIAFHGRSQNQYIRNDVTICKAYEAVSLGIANPNPDHCYQWGFTSDPVIRSNPNPTVTPNQTLTYICHITDSELSFSAHEHVKVTVSMGTISVLGEPIIPDLSDLEGQAYLQVQETVADQVVWSIHEDPDGTGCTIESSGDISAFISNCFTLGDITVRATNAEDAECYIDKQINIGPGIIELVARDEDDPVRVAYHSETLHVVGPSTVRFNALPIASRPLAEGHPEWGGDVLPEEEHTLQWETAFTTPGTYIVTCSGFVVTVVVLPDEQQEFNIATDVQHWLSFKEAVQDLAPFFPNGCSRSPRVDINAANTLRGTKIYKEKDQSPNYYYELQVTQDQSSNTLQSEGCANLGDYSDSYSIPGFGSFTLDAYLSADDAPETSIDNQVLLVSDPETEMLEETVLQFTGSIQLNAFPTINGNEVDVFVSTGSFPVVSSTLTGELQLDGEQINYRVKWGGLQMNPKGYMFTGSPSNPVWKVPVQFSYNIMDGKQSDWRMYANLSPLFD